MVVGKKIKMIAKNIEKKFNDFESAKQWTRQTYTGSKKDLNLLAKLLLRASTKK